MKIKSFLFLTIGFFLILMTMSGFSAEKKMKVKFIIGNVYHMEKNGKVWKKLSSKDKVTSTSLVKTLRKSYVVFNYNKKDIKISQNKVIAISDILKNKKSHSDYKSNLLFIFRKTDIKKSTNAAGVRGDDKSHSGVINWSEEEEEQHSDNRLSKYQRAKKKFLEEDYNNFISSYSKISNNFNDREKDEISYLLGLSYFEVGDIPKSSLVLGQLSKKSKYTKVKNNSNFVLAIIKSLQEKNKESISYLNRYIKSSRDKDKLPKAHYMMSQLYKEQGDTENSIKHLQEIINSYPESEEYKSATKEVNLNKLR